MNRKLFSLKRILMFKRTVGDASVRKTKRRDSVHLIPPIRVFPRPRSLFDPRLVGEGFREVMSYRVGESVYPTDVWVRIYENDVGGYLYHVEEPRLNPLEVAMYQDIMNLLYFEPPEVEESEKFFESVVKRLEELLVKYSAIYVGARINFVRYYLLREALGYGVIDPLMRDPHIEDVSCNGYYKPVYVWHTNFEYVETTMRIPERDLDRLVLKLAHISGKHLSIANPIVDAILPGGHRLAATYRKEVTTTGSSFTIRKFREKPISIVELIKLGTIDPYIAAYSWVMMEHKRNGMILGVTGAGKTTLLNAVATLIHPNYKVVTIEDTPELRLPLPNWVQLVAREFAASSDFLTSITLFDLVKLSLRYRPEIIMVGEVRGEEAYVLFQAMASVSRDTPIMVKDSRGRVSLVNIGDLVDRFYEPGEERVAKPVKGLWVLSHDGFRVTWKPLRYVLRHSVNEIYRIIGEGGVELRATGSHSVFVLDPEDLEVKVKRVDELSKGDLLLTPARIYLENILDAMDEEDAFKAGLSIAEYCQGGKSKNVAYTSRRIRIEGHQVIVRLQDAMDQPGYRSGFGYIPSSIWVSSPPVAAALFKGLNYRLHGVDYSSDIRCLTRDERLALELVWLARLKGFDAKVRYIVKGGRKNYRVTINSGVETLSCMARVPVKPLLRIIKSVSGSIPDEFKYLKDNDFVGIEEAKAVINWAKSQGGIQSGLARLIRRVEQYVSGDLRPVTVIDVKKESYCGYVYDVSVPGSESFMGGNIPILLHNTGHGGVSTMHAESIESAVDRLTSPPMNIPRSYIPLIHFAMMIRRVDKGGKAARRVTNVWEIRDYNDYLEVFRWRASRDVFERRLEDSVTLKRIAEDLIDRPVEELLYREIPIRALLFHNMAKKGLLSFKNVAEVISRYYNDSMMKDRVLSEAGEVAEEDEFVRELLDSIRR